MWRKSCKDSLSAKENIIPNVNCLITVKNMCVCTNKFSYDEKQNRQSSLLTETIKLLAARLIFYKWTSQMFLYLNKRNLFASDYEQLLDGFLGVCFFEKSTLFINMMNYYCCQGGNSGLQVEKYIKVQN